MKARAPDNLGLKLVSLLLGFSLWYAVARDEGAEFAFSIPIELRDLPEGLEVVEESVQQVEVRVRGPSETLRRMSPHDIHVGVDLRDAEPGPRVAYLTSDDVTVPFGVRVMRVTPSSLDLSLDRTLERTVKVIPRIVGSPAEGYQLSNIELAPEEVKVVGPASLVEGLEQVTTAPVSAEGLREPFSRTVRVELDRLVRLSRGSTVEVTLDVREEWIRKELARVPLVSEPPGVEARLNPAEVRVTVEGPRSLVEPLDAEALRAEVRLDGLGPGRHRLLPIIHVLRPAELAALRIVSVKPAEIEARIQ